MTTTNRLRAGIVILLLALHLAGCSSPTSPHAIDKTVATDPGPAVSTETPTVATGSLTLSGVALTGGIGWEHGPPVDGVPVQGVSVRIQQGDRLVEVTTDANGRFTASGWHSGVVQVDLKKDGYRSNSLHPTMNQNLQLYARLFPGVDMPNLDIFSNVTLSGVVFEETANGRSPIPGATVYCEPCGVETHTFATTDDNGFYSFTGVWTDAGHFPIRILVRLDGYTDPSGLPTPTPPNPSGPGWREVVVRGDTRFDMELVRR